MDPLQLTNYARGLLARLSQGGWRPFIGWGGAFVFYKAYMFAMVGAPQAGIVLSGEYYGALNFAFGLYLTTFIARGVEKVLERGPVPGGGLVNNEALQASA